MADRARKIIEAAHGPDTEAAEQQEAALKRGANRALTPIFSEYAQELARTGLADTRENELFYSPTVVLSYSSEGYPAATLNVRVQSRGRWQWVTEPGATAASPEALEMAEKQLTHLLAEAMERAGQRKKRLWRI